MALPPSTANWHWKNKNVTQWAKDWFKHELPTISVRSDKDEAISVESVTEVDGDVELGQRKSKLITIFDCKVVMRWSGTTSDGTEVKGKLTIPEVSHEVTVDGLSDYSYEWSLTTAHSSEVDAFFDVVRKLLPPALETKFAEFPAAIVEKHGKDLTVSADSSRATTPAPATAASAAASTSAAPLTQAAPVSVPKNGPQKSVNTSTVSTEASFMATAADLFQLLTDEKRIVTWTRAPAKSTPEPGAEYSLFGGGVKGNYISLSPTEIKQTWALASPTWPEGHNATLTTTLTQGSDHTTMKLMLEGVPAGLEDEIRRNLEGYYIHGFKSIGLGSEL
ncbi:hypothetical protein FISHEDRAFT_68263 [Fistulina hepatica ATCC 64428]|uniref:Activator of Hsp90 ATPase AHSA1-like N-terminal domain-containing protein n=1 Tax=Fistulina hepatica ATCC 64428 TaxID=1128425 RepID=A0A0D6ZZH6_9AGAR|nr:hypothetical protein FISHEDRAFT_68263 [Fistulina hepatica ATCC 64428]